MALLRSYLFAPGNNPKIVQKALAAGADAVVIDLEDAVPPSEKAQARTMVAGLLEARSRTPGIPIYVRINGIETGLWKEDLAAVTGPALTGIRIPKADSAVDVRMVVDALEEREVSTGLPPGAIQVVCTVETAKGVSAAHDLAACRRVTNITFGAADFAQDVGVETGPEEMETLLARSQLVLASRAAGIDPPVASVYSKLADDEGLRRSTEANRRLGFFGRSVIHPRQIPTVHEIFTPGAEAVAQARRIVDTLERAVAEGRGTAVTDEGQFVDIAIARRAQAVLALSRLTEEKPKENS